jgi:glycosyltransferase involved in cell wall biosynthesis
MPAQSLNIALYANIAHPVPPLSDQILAPWQLTAELANRLVDRGHHVTLFAAKESQTKAKLEHRDISVRDFEVNGQRNADKINFLDNALLAHMYKRSLGGEFDLIHVHHSVSRSIYFTEFSPVPTLITLHDPILKQAYIYPSYKHVPQLHLVPISHNQTTAMPDLPYTEVVYNGVDQQIFTFGAQPGTYLVAASRIVPEKGFHTAIEVAHKLGIPLYIAGSVNPDSPRSVKYWNEAIAPHIDQRQVFYCGLLEPQQLAALYRGAMALLFPIEWDEPFGLVMAEAMSCGTPVVAFRRGAVPEVVDDRRTGFVVDNQAEMIRAVSTIAQIKRADCRTYVEQKFSLESMVNGYESVYQQILF